MELRNELCVTEKIKFGSSFSFVVFVFYYYLLLIFFSLCVLIVDFPAGTLCAPRLVWMQKKKKKTSLLLAHFMALFVALPIKGKRESPGKAWWGHKRKGCLCWKFSKAFFEFPSHKFFTFFSPNHPVWVQALVICLWVCDLMPLNPESPLIRGPNCAECFMRKSAAKSAECIKTESIETPDTYSQPALPLPLSSFHLFDQNPLHTTVFFTWTQVFHANPHTMCRLFIIDEHNSRENDETDQRAVIFKLTFGQTFHSLAGMPVWTHVCERARGHAYNARVTGGGEKKTKADDKDDHHYSSEVLWLKTASVMMRMREFKMPLGLKWVAFNEDRSQSYFEWSSNNWLHDVIQFESAWHLS